MGMLAVLATTNLHLPLVNPALINPQAIVQFQIMAWVWVLAQERQALSNLLY